MKCKKEKREGGIVDAADTGKHASVMCVCMCVCD